VFLGRKLALLLSIFLLIAAPQVRAQQSAEAAPLAPKIVLQTLPFGGVEVAGWTPDDRYIISAVATSRTAVIWDTETGHIIDKLILPSHMSDGQYSMPRFTELKVTPDGKTVIIKGDALELNIEVKQVLKRPLEYRIDLKSRAIEMIVGEASASTLEEFQAVAAVNLALAEYYDHSAGIAEEPKLAPTLPSSHDGKRQLARTPQGMAITAEDGKQSALEAPKSLRIKDAEMSPDFQQFAMIRPVTANDRVEGNVVSLIDVFTVETGQFRTPVPLDNDYSQLQWFGDGLLIATQRSDIRGRQADFGRAEGLPPPIAFIGVEQGGKMTESEARCFTVVSPDKRLFGAGLANCRSNAGAGRDVERFDINSESWKPFGKFRLANGSYIDALAVSEAGGTVGIATTRKDNTIELVVLDSKSGEIVARHNLEGAEIVTGMVLPTDDMMVVTVDNRTVTWLVESNSLVDMPLRSFMTTVVDADERILAVAGIQDDVIGRMELENFEAIAPVDYGKIIAGGFLPDRPIFWALSTIEGLRFWNTSEPQWSEILTTYFFEGQGFVTVNPQGRYDSNLGPDVGAFRWLVDDRPFQSLPQQTFMRDFYLPGMTEKLIDCSSYGDCEVMLDPLPDVKRLTRATPDVQIVDVSEGSSPELAMVTLEIREGFDKDAPRDRQSSGIYNPRLFVNNRLVEQVPFPDFAASDQSLEDWRKQRVLPKDYKPKNGVYTVAIPVSLPTLPGTEDVLISAYAFNKDRIKSETAQASYKRGPVTPVKPRAFIISIGINAYQESRLNLNYAANDAVLFHDRLPDIAGYEMRRLKVTGNVGGDTKVTSFAISTIVALLAGIDRAEGLKELKALGIDGSMLEESRPDDVIIFSFSGHGWAAPGGDFYLIPQDGVWDARNEEPVVESLISAAELSGWFSLIRAAEIVLVIDACHSGATVDSGRFKPGPMGDAGLGQLAYDKGIRILAATQANDVAMEDDKLRHGRLSYALAAVGQALDNPAGAADLDDDKKLMLDEWLVYPTWSLLSMNDEKEVRDTDPKGEEEGAFFFPNREPRKEDKVQLPSLFDFGTPSAVVLKAFAE
jgi:WD40 repeat protein